MDPPATGPLRVRDTLFDPGRSAAMAVSASGAGPDADTCSRQSEAVSAARPRWRAKNRAELSRSYSGTG